MKKLFAVMILIIVFMASLSIADTIVFKPPVTWNSQWDESESIIFDQGVVSFDSMVLIAVPTGDYLNIGAKTGTLVVDFMDINNHVIKEDVVSLPFYGTLAYTLTDSVEGVHQIYFPMSGGFRPSLESITYNNSVPEPETLLLLGIGLLGVAGIRR